MRSVGILLACLVAAVSLAGCSSHPPDLAPPLSLSTTVPPQSCANDQIHVKYGKGLAGQGQIGAVILFTNISPVPCTLSGYPVVVAVDSANTQTPLKETPTGPLGGISGGGSTIPVVRLTQDNSASATIEAVAHTSSGGACPTYSSILVGLPGGSPVFVLPAVLPYTGRNLSACDPPPQVHPFFPGFNGY